MSDKLTALVRVRARMFDRYHAPKLAAAIEADRNEAVRAEQRSNIAGARYRAQHGSSNVERELAAEEFTHHVIKRANRIDGRDSGPTDFERRQAAEERRQRQMRGERVQIAPWVTTPNSVRR